MIITTPLLGDHEAAAVEYTMFDKPRGLVYIYQAVEELGQVYIENHSNFSISE